MGSIFRGRREKYHGIRNILGGFGTKAPGQVRSMSFLGQGVGVAGRNNWHGSCWGVGVARFLLSSPIWHESCLIRWHGACLAWLAGTSLAFCCTAPRHCVPRGTNVAGAQTSMSCGPPTGDIHSTPPPPPLLPLHISVREPRCRRHHGVTRYLRPSARPSSPRDRSGMEW